MEDFLIVNLYWARKESAITESDRKYGRILRSLSFSVLSSREDAEECVNDTYLAAWNAMPTARPDYLGAFLSKITRRISIDRYRAAHRQKRGGLGGVLAELSECIPSSDSVEADYENGRLADALNQFLASLPAEERNLFILRYYNGHTVARLAKAFGMKPNNLSARLYRTREKLRAYLAERGYQV